MVSDDLDDGELFLSEWLTKGKMFAFYFQPGPLSETLTIANL